MYNEASVLGTTLTAATAGTVAFTGFSTMLWVWAALFLVFGGLLVLRWSAVVGATRTGPPAQQLASAGASGRSDGRDR